MSCYLNMNVQRFKSYEIQKDSNDCAKSHTACFTPDLDILKRLIIVIHKKFGPDTWKIKCIMLYIQTLPFLKTD